MHAAFYLTIYSVSLFVLLGAALYVEDFLKERKLNHQVNQIHRKYNTRSEVSNLENKDIISGFEVATSPFIAQYENNACLNNPPMPPANLGRVKPTHLNETVAVDPSANVFLAQKNGYLERNTVLGVASYSAVLLSAEHLCYENIKSGTGSTSQMGIMAGLVGNNFSLPYAQLYWGTNIKDLFSVRLGTNIVLSGEKRITFQNENVCYSRNYLCASWTPYATLGNSPHGISPFTYLRFDNPGVNISINYIKKRNDADYNQWVKWGGGKVFGGFWRRQHQYAWSIGDGLAHFFSKKEHALNLEPKEMLTTFLNAGEEAQACCISFERPTSVLMMLNYFVLALGVRFHHQNLLAKEVPSKVSWSLSFKREGKNRVVFSLEKTEYFNHNIFAMLMTGNIMGSQEYSKTKVEKREACFDATSANDISSTISGYEELSVALQKEVDQHKLWGCWDHFVTHLNADIAHNNMQPLLNQGSHEACMFAAMVTPSLFAVPWFTDAQWVANVGFRYCTKSSVDAGGKVHKKLEERHIGRRTMRREYAVVENENGTMNVSLCFHHENSTPQDVEEEILTPLKKACPRALGKGKLKLFTDYDGEPIPELSASHYVMLNMGVSQAERLKLKNTSAFEEHVDDLDHGSRFISLCKSESSWDDWKKEFWAYFSQHGVDGFACFAEALSIASKHSSIGIGYDTDVYADLDNISAKVAAGEISATESRYFRHKLQSWQAYALCETRESAQEKRAKIEDILEKMPEELDKKTA
jgi:hypothetical protein